MADTNGVLGVGLGLRPELSGQLVQEQHRIDFLEVITESCFDGATAEAVRALRSTFPVVCHGINMSLGTAEPMDDDYLAKVYRVLGELDPCWFSDHIAMTHVGGLDIGHLAPLSLSEQTVATVVQKVRRVQAEAGRSMLVENIAYYFEVPESDLPEYEVITEIVRQADCGLLLDLNNLLANARNHRYDPYQFLDKVPLDRLVQVHLAGGAWRGGVYVDTHGHAVDDDVWRFLEYVCRRSSVKAVLLERDVNVPPLSELLVELDHARAVMRGSSA